MTSRQQKRFKKQQSKKTQSQTTITKNDNSLKKEQLTQLSGIMKGIVIYKTEVAELWRLLAKYPEQVKNLNVAYA